MNITWDSLCKWSLAALLSILVWQFNRFDERQDKNTQDIAEIQGDMKVIRYRLGIGETTQASNLTNLLVK